MHNITLTEIIDLEKLYQSLTQITFAGIYDKDGGPLYPYKKVKFSLAEVYPPTSVGAPPKIIVKSQEPGLFEDKQEFNLFTSQPTVYQNQLEIMAIVDKFLAKHNFKINRLSQAIAYDWEGKGSFHILPPIIEKHSFDLDNGYINLEKLSTRFQGTYIRDARQQLHHLGSRYLNGYFIDEVSKINHLDIFHSHAPIINYGLHKTGKFEFHVICDGSHRIDYALETLQEPITVLLVEGIEDLLPYYAFPVSFSPTMRLSSKQSEKMYVRLERDKIHLLHDLINKVLRYDWTKGNLSVSKLRSNKDIY
ncbi:hypothetical protein KA517_03200 [Candidatus Gracilibacteria bacterium]|nr:hypothetical protein [Candidatus Gracilibacteria bacterium]